MKNKKILLFCNSELLDFVAITTRILSLAKMLKTCGYSVELWGVTYNKDRVCEGECEGFPYSLIYCPAMPRYKAFQRAGILNKKIDERLRNLQSLPDAVLLYGTFFEITGVFLRFSEKNGVPLATDAMEWFDAKNSQFAGLPGKIRLFQNRYALKVIYVKIKNIIAISSLLGDYYKSRGCHTCVIPTVVDMEEYEGLSHTEQAKLQIAYAGHPAQKDYVVNVVKAASLLSEREKSKIEIHFYGASREHMIRLGIENSVIENTAGCVFFHGNIPHKLVKSKISEADFTVLLRPNKRYANAGFPTKVGESMACGTPVIGNITSDLGKYIIDGKTGIVCEDESAESCAKALRKALSLPSGEKAKMREETLNMARKSFDYKCYVEAIEAFLNKME